MPALAACLVVAELAMGRSPSWSPIAAVALVVVVVHEAAAPSSPLVVVAELAPLDLDVLIAIALVAAVVTEHVTRAGSTRRLGVWCLNVFGINRARKT